jgi:hypothetical protein
MSTKTTRRGGAESGISSHSSSPKPESAFGSTTVFHRIIGRTAMNSLPSYTSISRRLGLEPEFLISTYPVVSRRKHSNGWRAKSVTGRSSFPDLSVLLRARVPKNLNFIPIYFTNNVYGIHIINILI